MAFVSSGAATAVNRQPKAMICGARDSSFMGSNVSVRAVVAPAPVAPLPVMPDIVASRHRKRIKKLNRAPDQRKALMRTLTTELIRHGRITTTLEKCKAMRPFVDHMITLCKDGSLHARRQAMGFIYDKQLVHALFEQGAERFKDRNGGYTRVVRTMPRKGDNASMGIIELV